MARSPAAGRWWRGLATTAVAAMAAPAAAQVPAVPLPSRQEVTPPTPDAEQRSSASVDSSGALARSACPFENSPLKLTVNTVRFTAPDGGALAPRVAAALAGVSAPHGDQPISLICQLRDDANRALQKAGWVASVQIPAQQINGTLLLQVVTAHIVEVRARGDAGPYTAVLRDRIRRLQAMNPLNEREAERLLLLAGDIPGLQVQLSLRPAGTGQQGAVIGELTTQFRRASVLANVQNYNSRLLGPTSIYVRGELYGLTGLGDLTYVGVSTTPDFRKQIVAQAGHIVRLDGNGLTLGGRFTYAWSRPDLGALDFRTNTLIAGLDVQRPLIRTLRLNTRTRAGFDLINQDTTVHSNGTAVPLTSDRLRVLFAGLDGSYSRLAANGGTAFSFSASLDLRKGIGVLGASERGGTATVLTSRVDGNARALVARGVLDTTVGLGPIFSIAGEAQAQWADSPLLNYEQLAVGNLTIGRGYDPGADSGDRLVGGHGELRAGLPLLRRLAPQLFGFYDYVFLRNLGADSPEPTRTFRSFGGGGRFRLFDRFAVEVTYAHPQDKALLLDTTRAPDRVLVSVTAFVRSGAQ